MSLIAEFTIETPILRRALESVPDMVLHTEAIHLRPDEPSKSIISAWGDDFETFEEHMKEDPTIQNYERLTEYDDRRMYRFFYTAEGETALTYPPFVEYDIVMLDTTGTHEALKIRARFPDRDALMAYREACNERDVPFQLQTLYQEDKIAGDGGTMNPFGLTDLQYEVLVKAQEMGYYAVPRETTLEEIADELGITTQAVSTRLRRGQQNLLQNALRS